MTAAGGARKRSRRAPAHDRGGAAPADAPHDPNLPNMAGKRIREGGGMFSRELEAIAATRRRRAERARRRGDAEGAGREQHDAAYLERHAERFRDPLQAIGGPLAAGNGGEVVPGEDKGPDLFQEKVRQPPDMLAAEATEHRLTLTGKVSDAALTLALDAAESAGAEGALERNLAHQMAAAHAVGMAMLAKAHSFTMTASTWAPEGRQQMQSVEAARMATAAARVLEASQRAALALDRLKHGGRLAVTVQHVTVGDGGRAVVAGTVGRGAGERPSAAARHAKTRRPHAGGAGEVPQGDVEARPPGRGGRRRPTAARAGEARGGEAPRAYPRGGSRVGPRRRRRGSALMQRRPNGALPARFDTKRINHSIAFSDDGACTNQAESHSSRLRRAEWGQHHHISGKHLGAYVREMAWREDTRRRPNRTLHALAAGAALGHPVSRMWKGYWQRAARA